MPDALVSEIYLIGDWTIAGVVQQVPRLMQLEIGGAPPRHHRYYRLQRYRWNRPDRFPAAYGVMEDHHA